ncbi:MAG TPA: CPBP family intramembrane glutamic endopeptidase [Roseovarius sp.]
MRYHAHHRLTAPALTSAALWRLLAGCALTAVIFVALTAGYAVLCDTLLPAAAWGPDGNGLVEATTAWGVLVNLFLFALLIAALGMVLPIVHHRRLPSLLGPGALAWRQARRAGGYVLGIYVVVSLLPLPDGFAIHPKLPLDTWLMLLPATLAGLLIQVSAEEILFRGYIQSQLAARFSHPAVWIVLPSVLFGLLHYQPGVMGDATWLIVIWAMLFGLAAADLTARTGTLGPAIALHLINNLSAIALVAPQGNFDGLALYTYPFGPEDSAMLMRWLPVDLLVLLCSWLAARLALRV